MALSKRRRPADDEDEDVTLFPVVDDEDEEDEDDDQEDDEDEAAAEAPQYVVRRPVKTREGADADDDQIVPDRIVRLALPAPWKNLRIYAWLDYPEDIAAHFGPKRDDETNDDAGERIIEGMRKVIVKHDGWRDSRGHAYPQPSKRAFWTEISTPLARAITNAFFAAMRRNPTQGGSPKKTQKRSR